MEDQWYVVPELEVRIHQSWVTLIRYCQETLPYGDLRVQIANALPTKKLKESPKIRFDKRNKANNSMCYVIPSTGDRIHESWINLIQWCQNYFMSGTIEFRLVNSQPTDLLNAQQSVRFDKPETIPDGSPLNFSG